MKLRGKEAQDVLKIKALRLGDARPRCVVASETLNQSQIKHMNMKWLGVKQTRLPPRLS
jgi:hypothetical protein